MNQGYQEVAKRRKRKRNKRKLTSFDFLNDTVARTYREGREFLSSETKRKNEIENSKGIQLAEKAKRDANGKARLEVEGFLSSIPFGSNIKAVVQFLQLELQSIGGSNAAGLVRCQLLENKKPGYSGHSGCALVVFESIDIYRQLSLRQLRLEGRLLRLSEGNGNSISRRRRAKEPVTFQSSKLSLSTVSFKEGPERIWYHLDVTGKDYHEI